MLHLLSDRHHLAFAVGSHAAHHRAVPPPTLVHLEQLAYHRAVARHNHQHQHQHDGGVQVGVGSVLTLLWVHVYEAPCAGAVLHVSAKSRKRKETEQRTEEEQQWDCDIGAFLGDVLVVQVGVANGEASLQCHQTQKRHGGQAEEGHGDTKVFTHNLIFRHPHQCGVPRVRQLHEGADQAGARQVCDHQRRDQDLKQSPPPRVPGPVLSTPPDFQDHQGSHVAKDAGGEHDGTDQAALGAFDVVLAVTWVVSFHDGGN